MAQLESTSYEASLPDFTIANSDGSCNFLSFLSFSTVIFLSAFHLKDAK